MLENIVTFSKYAFALLPIPPLLLCVVTSTYTYALLHTMILVFFYDLRSISTSSLEVWINSGAWDVVQLVGCLPTEYKVLGFNPQFCINWHVNASRSKVQGHPQLYRAFETRLEYIRPSPPPPHTHAHTYTQKKERKKERKEKKKKQRRDNVNKKKSCIRFSNVTIWTQDLFSETLYHWFNLSILLLLVDLHFWGMYRYAYGEGAHA